MTTTIFPKRPLLVFLIHWIAWLVLSILFYLLTHLYRESIPLSEFLFNCGLMGSVNFILFYIVAFYLVPVIAIRKKQWLLLAVLCVVLAVVFSYIRVKMREADSDNRTIETLEVKGLPTLDRPADYSGKSTSIALQGNVFYSLTIVLIAVGYRLLLTIYMQEKARQELENQKLKAELSFLKLQINPHFLFNALNNIYALAVLEKAKRTGDSIMKLSDLIRYMLYEKEDDLNRVSLDMEIGHINSFIDLQKLRHTEDIYIHFSIEGETLGKKIPPLLLFPLIENSCKHGIVKNAEKPISIQIKVTGSILDFSIHNFKNDDLKDPIGGIGLENVRRRLALLFQDKHTLNIRETEKEFSVELQLPL